MLALGRWGCKKNVTNICRLQFPHVFEKNILWIKKMFDVLYSNLNKMQAENHLVERPLVLHVCRKKLWRHNMVLEWNTFKNQMPMTCTCGFPLASTTRLTTFCHACLFYHFKETIVRPLNFEFPVPFHILVPTQQATIENHRESFMQTSSHHSYHILIPAQNTWTSNHIKSWCVFLPG